MTDTINYDGRIFASVANAAGGDVDSETVFHYRQKDDVVWATYAGGAIVQGTLIARVLADGCLDMRYQHVTTGGELKTGRCRSVPFTAPDGRLGLEEQWEWTEGGIGEGRSRLEERPAVSDAASLAARRAEALQASPVRDIVRNRSNAEHYAWGEVCEGWRLVDRRDLSVIEERMPPGSRERRHRHALARQCYVVLAGTLQLDVGGRVVALEPHDAVELEPGVAHTVVNGGAADAMFLVVSAPSTRGDREELERSN
jgi:mannose-6-phosphate isomerase-like protein (cupin superfamily)